MIILVLMTIIIFLSLLFLIDKYNRLYWYARRIIVIQDQWLQNLIEGKKIQNYFLANHFRRIGLIGDSNYTYPLWRELENEGLQVEFCVVEKEIKGLPGFPGLSMIDKNELIDRISEVDILVDTTVEHNRGVNERIELEPICGVEIVCLSNLLFYSSEV